MMHHIIIFVALILAHMKSLLSIGQPFGDAEAKCTGVAYSIDQLRSLQSAQLIEEVVQSTALADAISTADCKARALSTHVELLC